MWPKAYRVELPDEERVQLHLLVRQGRTPARALQRAHAFLWPAQGTFEHEESTGAMQHVSLRTV